MHLSHIVMRASEACVPYMAYTHLLCRCQKFPVVQLRTQAEFEAANGVKAPAGKRYFQHTRLHDIIGSYPFRLGLADAQLAEEKNSREAFLDFLLGVLVGTRRPYHANLDFLV